MCDCANFFCINFSLAPQTPTTISLPISYWDFSTWQNRTLDLQCPYQSPPDPPEATPWIFPTAPSATEDESGPSIATRTEVFCSFQQMKVVLPPGPISEIVLKGVCLLLYTPGAYGSCHFCMSSEGSEALLCREWEQGVKLGFLLWLGISASLCRAVIVLFKVYTEISYCEFFTYAFKTPMGTRWVLLKRLKNVNIMQERPTMAKSICFSSYIHTVIWACRQVLIQISHWAHDILNKWLFYVRINSLYDCISVKRVKCTSLASSTQLRVEKRRQRFPARLWSRGLSMVGRF